MPLPNVVRSLFASSISGAIAFNAEGGDVSVRSAMHRVLPDGSRRSVEIPLASASDLLARDRPGEAAVPPAPAASERRVSLGLVNPGRSTAVVLVELLDRGPHPTRTLKARVEARSYRLVPIGSPTAGTRVRVRPEEASARVLAHLAVVDEATPDWRFLPLAPLRDGSP